MVDADGTQGTARGTAGAVAPAGSPQDQRNLALFGFLLGAAIVFHQSKLGDWEVFSLHALVTLAAIWCMLRPSSLSRLLGMLGIHLVSLFVDMPLVVNHWLLLGFVELGLFVALGIGWVRRESWLRDPGAIYRALAPYVRLQVVLVYTFAALSKFNDSFLDRGLSCGADMLGDLVARVPVGLDASFLDWPAIYATIGIELALPILLCVRATRIPALFLGGGFHLMLALAGHLPFSGFAFAFYALFAPDDLPARFDRVRAARPALDSAVVRVQALARSPLAFPALAAAFLIIAAGITYGPGGSLESAVVRGFLAAFVLYAAVLGALLALCLAQGSPFTYQRGWLRLAGPAWVIGPLLVVLNALSPYAGLKTQSTFTMYSNIQTEAEQWNHTLVPQEVQVFSYQDDLVRIVASSDEDLAEAADNNRRWVWWQLRAWAADNPGASVTYVRDGRVHSVDRAGDDPELGEAPNVVLRKLFLFRDVPPASGNDCRIDRSAGSHQGS